MTTVHRISHEPQSSYVMNLSRVPKAQENDREKIFGEIFLTKLIKNIIYFLTIYPHKTNYFLN